MMWQAKRGLWMLVVLVFSGCATAQNDYDPLEPINRPMDSLNTTVDKYTLKPVAKVYVAATTPGMRTTVTNFFDHWMYLNTILHDFLQGKFGQGAEDLARFMINSTLGIGGLVDVAEDMGLDKHYEDFGQTLAVWGFSEGAYIVYPLLGPNSLRKTPDFVTSSFTDGMFWLSAAVAPAVTLPIYVLKYVNVRANLLAASDMRDELALDPYVFTREAWRQSRQHLIYDGHPPIRFSAEDEDDEWASDDDAQNSQSMPSSVPIPTGIYKP